jgi:AraC-like DNA-binding protein
LNILLLLAAIFGFVLTSLFFIKKTTHTKASFFLGCFYTIISVYALQTYIIETNQIKTYSWFYAWPLLVYHLIPVPIYFYFVTVIKDQFQWKNIYLLLFVPFFLGVADMIYVYTAPKEVYNQLLTTAITKTEDRFNAHYFLFSLSEHYLMRHVWQLGSLLIILPKLQAFLKEGIADRLKLALNKWVVFFWILLVALSLLAILHATELLFDVSVFNYLLGIDNGSVIVTFTLYVVVLIIGIVPVYFPTILHGYPRYRKPQALIAQDFNQSDELKFRLDEAEIKIKLEALIENKRYLDSVFTVTSCARGMDIPAHHLSYFISNHYGQNFASFKNVLRIAYAKELMNKGFLENSTIEALAMKCGFGNRSSFSKTFKIVTNQSPTEYLLNLRST